MSAQIKQIDCANCGRAIRRPVAGSYPPAVQWVHHMSPLGMGNRYCDNGGNLARPSADRAGAEPNTEPEEGA